MRILFVGDIYGELGRMVFYNHLDAIKKEHKINLVIVNGENLAGGRGINTKIYKELMSKGVSAITMGNHTYGNKEIYDLLDDSKIVIPANYPSRPKQGYITINYNGEKVLIMNLLGRVYMNYLPLDCPFKVAKEIIEKEKADYYIIDFHAEATSEKIALGHYVDGIRGAVVGTHTHVATADERVLNKGTMYISDIGMTGALDGVLGVDANLIIDRFVAGANAANKPAIGKGQFNAVVLDFDNNKIYRINLYD